ncbi:MAG: hypothetical protein GC159_16690 [Phycisphaera sp.]|nr:hypothetical protein [Phycisphaera sp.]
MKQTMSSIGILSVLAACLFIAKPQAARAAGKPNIVIILVDDKEHWLEPCVTKYLKNPRIIANMLGFEPH